MVNLSAVHNPVLACKQIPRFLANILQMAIARRWRGLLPIVLMLLVSLSASVKSAESLVVIVHPDNPIQSLERQELADLYLGRGQRVAGHIHIATLYDYASDSRERERFYLAVTGQNIARINAYWARLRFSGQMTPPTVQSSSQAMLQAVRNNPRSIGYIPYTSLDTSVRVVAYLDSVTPD